MSIKTLRKRIALVAVSALGVGLLSVAPASAALDAQPAIAAATTYPGVCSVASDSTTAVMKVGGIVQITPSQATAADDSYADISGPGEFAQIDTSGVTYNTLGQAVVTSDTDFVGVRATAVGTIKVNWRNSSTGSVAYVSTLTVVASCQNGTVSTAYSFIQVVDKDSGEAFGARSMTDNVDQTGETIVDGTSSSDGTGYIRAKLRDVYNATLPSTGIVEVVATGDVVIGVSAAATSDSAVPSLTTAKRYVASGTGEDLVIGVGPDSGAPTVSTVTISYNGTVVATKTITFLGAPAKVVVSDVTVGERKSAANGKGYFRYTVTDAAGNPLGGRVAVADSVFNAGAVETVSSVAFGNDSGAYTDSTTGKTPAITATEISEDDVANFTCTNKGGTAQLKIKVATSSAAVEYVTSDAFTVACGGSADTWTISMDKASYAPGEIATLTVAAKDEKGFPVHSLDDLGTVEYSFGGMTFVTAPTSVDYFNSAAGAKTYKLSVGTTEGSFVGTFKITGTTDTAAKTVQYKVAATSASVTNAEVLAAIVKLIASINKQIRQLQKQLRR